MGKRSTTADYKLLLASIYQVKVLATGATLELNRNQCKYLNQELQKLAKFLGSEDVKQLVLRYISPSSSPSSQSIALLRLQSVVNRARNLVQQCCQSKGTWLKRALTLYAMREDVLDVLRQIRWWTSVLSMLIDDPSSKLSKPIRVKRANQEFDQGLKSRDELEKEAVDDRTQLLNRINGEMQVYSDPAKSNGSKKRHRDHYVLLLQVRALSTGEDDHSTPLLNDYTHESRNALVGQGSFGVVNRVTWSGYECVLKQCNTLKPEDIEVDTLKRLHHPNIVRFFRHWKDENIENHQSHILMERMEKDLEEHIESVKMKSGQARPFSLPVAIDIMLQMINAIWYMHREGIVHRDLKPKNVLVCSKNDSVLPKLSAEGYVQVKLADFGIAKPDMMTSNAGALTLKTGTTMYRAPELASEEYTQGDRTFPLKCDMWSFGMMCFRILTGKQPFTGIEGNALQSHVENGGRPSIPDDCPDYLRFCMEKCWEMNPEHRPRSVDMWRMLRVAQLRILGLLDQNYDFFSFNDHSNKQTLQLAPTAAPQGEGWRSYNSVATVHHESLSFTLAGENQEFVSFTEEATRPPAVFRDSGNSQGLLGILQGCLFNNLR